MIRSWYNTKAVQLAGMTDISDEMILKSSNGEVINPTEYIESESRTGKISDPEIFGDLSKENLGKVSTDEIEKMGHIVLPIPIVNIQYTRGKKPVLAKELGMTLKELESVIYGRTYITSDADASKTIPAKEYLDDPKYSKAGYLTGAEAVKKVMEMKQVPEEIRKSAVLNVVPVMPACMRYFWCEPEKRYQGSSLNNLYESLLLRIKRYQRLLSIQCPEVILINERRELQGYADRLISNGAHGSIGADLYTCLPNDSLEELYEAITEDSKKKGLIPESVTDVNIFLKKAEEIRQYDLSLSDETYFADSPEAKKLEAMEADLKSLMRPFVEAYVNENHKMYEEFMELIFQYAVHALPYAASAILTQGNRDGLAGYHPEDEENQAYYTECVKELEKGIAKTIDVYIKKQLRFEAV